MIYDHHIANSYQSYRPKLHSLILGNTFTKNDSHFHRALDIGCGVGHSSTALLPYSESVIGLDMSEAMLARAKTHKKISYQHSNSPELNFKPETFDLITFAGSLFYCKSDVFLQECLRVLHDKGIVLVYDFTVDLNPVLLSLELNTMESDYDPTTNLDDVSQLHLEDRFHFQHRFLISREDLPFILFSDTTIKGQLSLQSSGLDALKSIGELIVDKVHEQFISCTAELYCSRYQLSK